MWVGKGCVVADRIGIEYNHIGVVTPRQSTASADTELLCR